MPETYIIAPNKRLARHLEKNLNEANNQAAWVHSNVLPLELWLAHCWKKCINKKLLIDSTQEKGVWLKIILSSDQAGNTGIIDNIMEFHHLINDYGIDSYKIEPFDENFLIFYRKFKQYCEEKNLVTIAEVPKLLIPQVEKLAISKLTLVAFDEYSPSLKLLLAAFRKHRCIIAEYDSNYFSPQINRVSFDQPEDELVTAACWAKKKMEHDQGMCNIGIIIPRIVAIREKVTSIFHEVFKSNYKNVNISLGISLTKFPITAIALLIISINPSSSTLGCLANLIISPYLRGAKTESSTRARLFNHLNKHKNSFLGNFSKIISDFDPKLEILSFDFSDLFFIYSQIEDKKLLPSEWIKLFRQILQTIGWPGDEKLSTAEQHATNKFIDTLKEFSKNDFILAEISHKQAIQALITLLENQMIHPNYTSNDSQVNIMGTIEGYGMNFDYLWAAGMDEDDWPKLARPNPFIPIALQKKFNLPHSSSERELEFATNLVNKYKKSANEIIFSYVKYKNSLITQPSKLTSDITEISITDLNLPKFDSIAKKIFASKQLEILTDEIEASLKSNEKINFSSKLIELQSRCPFKAFAEFRLKLKTLSPPTIGVSAVDRGNIIHSTLEFFWKKVKTKQQLLKLDQDKLTNLITAGLTFALCKLKIDDIFKELETAYLLNLLMLWLNTEKFREDFEVIALEQNYKITLRNEVLEIRIDRIDQLANGKKILIDYKTGKTVPTISDWFNPRPKQPQLLLYSLALGDELHCLAVAQINNRSVGLREITINTLAELIRKNTELNDKSITWNSIKHHWKNTITTLLEEFIQGKFSPIPTKNGCTNCNLAPLCRQQVETFPEA